MANLNVRNSTTNLRAPIAASGRLRRNASGDGLRLLRPQRTWDRSSRPGKSALHFQPTLAIRRCGRTRSEPPQTAGEAFDHGVIFRIHPSAREIEKSYSGCQMVWATDKNHSMLFALVEIKSGDPIRIWSPHPTIISSMQFNGLIEGQ